MGLSSDGPGRHVRLDALLGSRQRVDVGRRHRARSIGVGPHGQSAAIGVPCSPSSAVAIAALHEVALPAATDELPGLEVVTRYVPLGDAGTIGGDWWDSLPLPDGTIGLAVGDVAGHGVPSAAVMGQVRNALRSELVAGKSPAEALTGVGTFLDWTHPSAHCTAIAARLSARSGSFRWCSAGHPPPLVVTADGETTFLRSSPAPPLGVVGRIRYKDKEAVLRPQGHTPPLHRWPDRRKAARHRRRPCRSGRARQRDPARRVSRRGSRPPLGRVGRSSGRRHLPSVARPRAEASARLRRVGIVDPRFSRGRRAGSVFPWHERMAMQQTT